MDRQPLYSRVADRLATDIASGRYAIGTTLPAEPALALQLGVSRSTVRAALASLEARKLVSRKKNAGTRVEALSPQSGYGTSLTSLSDLIQWAHACKRVIQNIHTLAMNPVLANTLGCDTGRQWLCIQSLRFDATSNTVPVSWTQAYIDAAYADVLDAIKAHPSTLMSELLEKKYGLDLATVEQEVAGCKLDTSLAKALSANADDAALCVTRRYLTRYRQPVLITVSTHPAARYSIRTTLTRHE
jgi:DNA-binding GntR family transcriptional regulator